MIEPDGNNMTIFWRHHSIEDSAMVERISLVAYSVASLPSYQTPQRGCPLPVIVRCFIPLRAVLALFPGQTNEAAIREGDQNLTRCIGGQSKESAN